MRKQLKIVIVIIGICYGNSFLAQEDSDLASWNAVGIKYKLNKKITFDLEQHLRLKEDFSLVDEYFTQFETGYKFANNFEFVGGLRFIRENDTEGNLQGYENHFRYHADVKYEHKIKNLNIGYRLRYQNKNYLDEDDVARQNFRFKTDFEYKIKKWPLDPSFSAEIFNRYRKDADTNGFSKYRLTFGTDYKIKNFGKIKLFYRVEKELNADLPETLKIIGLKYTYTIKNKK
ncbi:DUF2490 domain-containing protein [Polaribacter sp.]|nr:DUF2490 domain-containing protein [Polaribacter sp.]